MLQRAHHSHASKGQQRLGLALTLAVHGLVLAAILSYAPARAALGSALPIMVSLIITQPELQAPRQAPKAAPPAKPLPAHSTQAPPPILVAAAPATVAAPYTVPAQPEPPKVAPSIAAPAALAPPAPLVLPRFDAAYLDNPAPAYPTQARRMKEQGKVTLRVLVNAAGAAERIEVRASSGSERLDQSALETVRRWRFVPAKQGAEAVSAWVLVPIAFTLEG